jgi:Mrr N-terminal domain
MRPDIPVELPAQGAVEKALTEILRARGNRPLRASDAYRLLADHFNLDRNQLRLRTSTGHELKWNNRCRSAREHLVEKGVLKRFPWDSWKLTDWYFKHGGPLAFDSGGDPPDF